MEDPNIEHYSDEQIWHNQHMREKGTFLGAYPDFDNLQSN